MKNAIDRYIILTIPSSIKRQWASLAGAVATGVPEDMVSFFKGEDARDYGLNMSYVAQSASEDGYPFFYQFAVGLESAYIKQSAGNVALFWGWARVLEWIADSSETCLLIWDDRIPNIEFNHIDNLCREMKAAGNFYIAQLRIRSDWANLQALGRPEYKFEDPYVEEQIFKHAMKNFSGKYLDTFFQSGLLGYDETMILSPVGANWLLQQMKLMEIVDIHKDFEFSETKELGIYETDLNPLERARLNNDNWLCWDPKFREATQEAIESKRGIYTPKKIGYKFVQEFLNFDSDVAWSPDGEHVVKFPSRIKFIDDEVPLWGG